MSDYDGNGFLMGNAALANAKFRDSKRNRWAQAYSP